MTTCIHEIPKDTTCVECDQRAQAINFAKHMKIRYDHLTIRHGQAIYKIEAEKHGGWTAGHAPTVIPIYVIQQFIPAMKKMVLGIIGPDERYETPPGNGPRIHRNELRATMRANLDAVLNINDKEEIPEVRICQLKSCPFRGLHEVDDHGRASRD